MRLLPPVPLSAEQSGWIIEARHRAVRVALRLAAGNRAGLTRDDLKALAEDGLMAAARTFDPKGEAEFDAFWYGHVRGQVLHALRAARRAQARVVRAEDRPRLRERALLDDLGAKLDAEAYDAWEDTDEDFMRGAQGVADDAMLVLILGQMARGTGAAERSILRRELSDQLDAAVASLEVTEARLMRMRFYEGMTFPRIAEVTGIPVSTLHLHLVRILRGLRRRMERGA